MRKPRLRDLKPGDMLINPDNGKCYMYLQRARPKNRSNFRGLMEYTFFTNAGELERFWLYTDDIVEMKEFSSFGFSPMLVKCEVSE